MIDAGMRYRIEVAIDVCGRPEKFLPSATFDNVVSFLIGLDWGVPIDSRFLLDFSDWLRDQVAPESSNPWPKLITGAAGSTPPIAFLGEQLQQFLSELESLDN